MTWPTGAKPPLHRRYDEETSLKLIRNRYAALYKMIPSQVATLQADEEFRGLCQDYYEQGYKDWLILSAILNAMLNWEANKLGIDPNDSKFLERFALLQETLDDTSYPAWLFDREIMDRMIATHNMTCLHSYGFQIRRSELSPEVVARFLSERMNHFELDLEHQPLFGEPRGEWPLL